MAKKAAAKSKAKTKKKKVGRPSDYRVEYCEKMIEYFKSPKRKTVYDIEKFQNGELKRKKPVVLSPNYPTLESFALCELGVSLSTLYEWESKHPEFAKVCEIARDMQRSHIMIGGLNKDFDAGFAKFLLMARWPELFKNGEELPDGQKLEITVNYGKDAEKSGTNTVEENKNAE